MAKRRGFTLIEVVVALAVVALGLIAAFNASIGLARGTSHMRERTLANWIALNEISRVRLAGALPDVGAFDGDVEFADTSWRWRARVSETGVENLRRMDVEVAYLDDPDVVLGRVSGFLAPPSPITTGTAWARTEAPGKASEEDEPEPPRPDEEQQAPEPPRQPKPSTRDIDT